MPHNRFIMHPNPEIIWEELSYSVQQADALQMHKAGCLIGHIL